MEQGNEKGKFDIVIVYEKFQAALQENDDVDLTLYLESFHELNKFFSNLGSIFGFVSSELDEKMAILNNFLKEPETAEKFKTVKTMIEHEKAMNLLNKGDYVSGSRTLLRIHRGLDFIQMFLKQIGELKNEEGTSSACRDAYDKTLANYHSWFIRQCAKLAMMTLPTKQNLLESVCGDQAAIDRAVENLPKTLESAGLVYDRIDSLYTLNDLHNLP